MLTRRRNTTVIISNGAAVITDAAHGISIGSVINFTTTGAPYRFAGWDELLC